MDQIKPEFLKNLMKFIAVLIWVLSLLVTHNFYLYRFTIQLVTHAVDKSYMFLIYNGLLVVVAKYSGLIVSSKPIEESLMSSTDKTFDYRDFESYNAILEVEYCSVDGRGGYTKSFLAEEVTETLDSCKMVSYPVDSVEEDAKDQEAEMQEEKEEEDLRGGFEEAEEEQEQEEENVGVITEEDMNKKFDEFIRKMKEELRIEAKRHLILV